MVEIMFKQNIKICKNKKIIHEGQKKHKAKQKKAMGCGAYYLRKTS